MPSNAQIDDDIAPLSELLDYAGNPERYEKRREMLQDLPAVDYNAIRAEALTLQELGEDLSEVMETLIRLRKIRHLLAKGWFKT